MQPECSPSATVKKLTAVVFSAAHFWVAGAAGHGWFFFVRLRKCLCFLFLLPMGDTMSLRPPAASRLRVGRKLLYTLSVVGAATSQQKTEIEKREGWGGQKPERAGRLLIHCLRSGSVKQIKHEPTKHRRRLISVLFKGEPGE